MRRLPLTPCIHAYQASFCSLLSGGVIRRSSCYPPLWQHHIIARRPDRLTPPQEKDAVSLMPATMATIWQGIAIHLDSWHSRLHIMQLRGASARWGDPPMGRGARQAYRQTVENSLSPHLENFEVFRRVMGLPAPLMRVFSRQQVCLLRSYLLCRTRHQEALGRQVSRCPRSSYG
jgi:hypothetical protein